MLVESFIASEEGEGIFWIISNWDRRIKIKATFVFMEFEYRTRDLGLIKGTVMDVKTSLVCSCKNLRNIRIVVLKLKIGNYIHYLNGAHPVEFSKLVTAAHFVIWMCLSDYIRRKIGGCVVAGLN